ncbi:MAG: hypothetical protein K8T20_16405 [Planctomycetes bacterium]|nr:hypothetical protein [Planctomycetota bacterium]
MRFLLAGLILFGTQVQVDAQYVDTLRLLKGRDIKGEVLKATCHQISVNIVDVTAAYPVDQVAGIDWDPTSIPASMAAGRKQLAAGQFAEAAESFGAAAKAKGTRGVLAQECEFMAAECCRRALQFAAGAEAYRSLFAARADTFYFRESIAGLVSCLTSENPPLWEEAHQAIAKWSAQAKELSLGDEILGDLKLEDARIFEREGQPLKALALYSGLTTHRTLRISWKAQTGIGMCELAQGQTEKAEATLRKVVDGATASQVAALRRAWNGLGECRLKKNAKSADDLKEALICFLRTVTLYVPAQGEQDEDHKVALLFAARCFRSLSEMEQGDLARAQYRHEFEKLKERFKESYGEATPDWEKKIVEPL